MALVPAPAIMPRQPETPRRSQQVPYRSTICASGGGLTAILTNVPPLALKLISGGPETKTTATAAMGRRRMGSMQYPQLEVTGKRGLPLDIRAVVFDFDDTIAETLPARIEATRLTFAAAGIRAPSPAEFVTSTRGVPLQVALDSFDGGRGAEMGLLDIYRALYWRKGPGFLRMFDGVRDLLFGVSAAGLGMGLLTSKARDIVVAGGAAGVQLELDELGIAGLFPQVIGFEDVTHPKPHPEGLHRLLDSLGAAPERTLVVGDSYSDIQAAHSAGCWSCLAAWGVPEDERGTLLATPDLVADEPLALLGLLTGPHTLSLGDVS